MIDIRIEETYLGELSPCYLVVIDGETVGEYHTLDEAESLDYLMNQGAA